MTTARGTHSCISIVATNAPTHLRSRQIGGFTLPDETTLALEDMPGDDATTMGSFAFETADLIFSKSPRKMLPCDEATKRPQFRGKNNTFGTTGTSPFPVFYAEL